MSDQSFPNRNVFVLKRKNKKSDIRRSRNVHEFNLIFVRCDISFDSQPSARGRRSVGPVVFMMAEEAAAADVNSAGNSTQVALDYLQDEVTPPPPAAPPRGFGPASRRRVQLRVRMNSREPAAAVFQ